MAGNSFGQAFKVTSFGESHGAALGCVVDGCPPKLELNETLIQSELDRRKPGTSKQTTGRREPDRVEILSGVFEGRTTGMPIAMLIRNQDARSKDYDDIKDQFRPGHADFTYFHKYGIRDYRGGGRSSARETVARVAAGAIAKQFLASHGVSIRAGLIQIGYIKADSRDWGSVNDNDFYFLDSGQVTELEAFTKALRREGDSIGARVLVEASGVPVGLGEPVFDKLDAEIASAMMGINAAKAVAIGDGFAVVEQKGSEHRDQMTKQGFLSNSAGGILGGISSGQTITVDVAFKPASSIRVPGRSLNETGEEIEVITTGRHDPIVGIRAVPICEAMLALVLMDHFLRNKMY